MSTARTILALARRSALLAHIASTAPSNTSIIISNYIRPLTSSSSSSSFSSSSSAPSPSPSMSTLSSSIYLSTSLAAKKPSAAASSGDGGDKDVFSSLEGKETSGYLSAVARQQNNIARKKSLAAAEKEVVVVLAKAVEPNDPAAY